MRVEWYGQSAFSLSTDTATPRSIRSSTAPICDRSEGRTWPAWALCLHPDRTVPDTPAAAFDVGPGRLECDGGCGTVWHAAV